MRMTLAPCSKQELDRQRLEASQNQWTYGAQIGAATGAAVGFWFGGVGAAAGAAIGAAIGQRFDGGPSSQQQE